MPSREDKAIQQYFLEKTTEIVIVQCSFLIVFHTCERRFRMLRKQSRNIVEEHCCLTCQKQFCYKSDIVFFVFVGAHVETDELMSVPDHCPVPFVLYR